MTDTSTPMEDLIESLNIFKKYDKGQYPTHCEHDKMFFSVSPDEVSDEDIERLDELGFWVDEEFDCFSSFKFGSC
jgi:hypothetical protein